jgi:hypothetical protein
MATMKKLAKLSEEWEKTLLLITAALVAIFFLILFWPSEQEGNISQQGTLPPSPNYVQTQNLAFLEPAKLEQAVNPMAFRRKAPSNVKSGKKTTPKTTPKTAQDSKKGDVKPPADTKKTDSTLPAVKPSPKTPPRVITLTYRGLYKGLLDTELAFLRSSDSAAKNKTSSFTLQSGEKLHDLFTIVSFDENQLTLLNHKEEKLTLPRNRDTKVTIE